MFMLQCQSFNQRFFFPLICIYIYVYTYVYCVCVCVCVCVLFNSPCTLDKIRNLFLTSVIFDTIKVKLAPVLWHSAKTGRQRLQLYALDRTCPPRKFRRRFLLSTLASYKTLDSVQITEMNLAFTATWITCAIDCREVSRIFTVQNASPRKFAFRFVILIQLFIRRILSHVLLWYFETQGN